MRSLGRIALSPHGDGAPLPTIFPALEDRKIRIRRGQVTLVASPPNSGKSLWALYYVIRLAQRGVRGLYFSADTDAYDQKVRAAAMVTGQAMEEVARSYANGGGGYFDAELEGLSSLRMDFETDPTYEYLSDGLLAYNESWGDYPEVVVIDNVGNVVTEVEDEYRGMKEVTRATKRFARLTGAAVILLHHVNETQEDPAYPAPRKNITGKVTQFVENALTVAFDDANGVMRFASVKNRSGRKDASGKSFAEIWIDPGKCQFYRTKFDLQNNGVAI